MDEDGVMQVKAMVFQGGNCQRWYDLLREAADWLEENPRVRVWDIVVTADGSDEPGAVTVYFAD